ncbi:OB-fold nucleic acid binding domain-containing protein [Methermicoccus shengliensis]|uniref:OB domain-containing protein n=1 Tax=Methermicoccus shengliensis TaxID=660064 RepID=A0A832RSW2_9EURY|nr:OB-fold nucleic acid binding domain-containing protein [Methermicoccus shengliensis]KUK04871.1 MAG: Nucleic acid binding OB-fold tRNA/helicase-type [Euryarchaeota archaeon 55_53]KUK30399.1 MAG: Nucleic acid binding OB-fold tRNA/helicase-type [Methanosarcinales archeaon 56_1174]MDI3487911.1 hypothetical protein [Methanosarcinales archaeon]MDN5295347.1 hypothetical protein [Methanosarcinales archaeon]HIH69565.1 hypothetical protein [Methermicoccus shengliensis]
MDRLTRQERAAIVLVFMVACSLVVLYWVVSPFSDEESGDHVSVSGTVLHLKKTASGGHLIITLDVDRELVKVFVPREAGGASMAERLHVGDEVRVTGRLQLYKGREEIVVLREKDVVLMSP